MSKSERTHKPQPTQGQSPPPTDQPDFDVLVRAMDGHRFLDDLEDKQVALLFLEPPDQLDTASSPNDSIRRSAETLRTLAPTVDRVLEDNGFAFWFPPSCPFATTESLENAVSRSFGFHRMTWVKSCSAHAPARHRIRMCYEIFYSIWPIERAQPIPIRSLPDVLRMVPDNGSEIRPNRAIKPVALYARLINACTHPSGLVVDPFAWTATSIEAALQLGRRVIGAETDPAARATAKDRLARRRMDFSDDPITAAFVNERGIATL